MWWAVAKCPRVRTGGGKSADFTHGVFMLAIFNFGAPGGAHPPSMPSPRCVPSVLRPLPGAFGYVVGLKMPAAILGELGVLTGRAI